jgi:hypothetical protein
MKLKLCSENCFQVKVTFDLVTPKAIGVFYPIWTIIPLSLNIVGIVMLQKLFSVLR